jgi:DnaJ-class molecular chaperone
MGVYFRLHPADDDPARLLDPRQQRSQPWAGTIYGRCDKCRGEGRTMHECKSCKQGSPRSDCPACGGEVRYLAECPACQGSSEIDDSEREGISVFPEEDGLYRYIAGRDGNVADAKLLLLEGEPTGDEDFDADEGAVLITPTNLVEVRDPDIARISELRGPRA